VILSIGHSTRSGAELLELLKANGVRTLVDIRLIPRSRRHPQFEQAALRESLAAAGIAYVHLPRLGGRRRPRPDSVNTAWRNESFRGYADYLQTPEFEDALDELLDLALRAGPIAIMCAEAVPWRCHRFLVADALVARGVPVEHILGQGPRQPHRLSSTARVEHGKLTYPA
jgi:uncharacterized protein (DUF488 family)